MEKKRLVEIIEGFSDFYHNYKNIDPPKGLTTIIQEYVASLPTEPKDVEKAAEEKYPFKWPFDKDDTTKDCDCNACQIARREGFVAGASQLSEGVANQGEEKNDNYWKQRCEAAEEVIKVMNVPKNKTGENTLTGHGNDQFCLFAERNHKWQSLKQQPASSSAEAGDQEKEIAQLKEENQKLREWKESAISVMPDMQAIGKELNIPLGQSIHDKVLPGIKRLKGLIGYAHQHGFANAQSKSDIEKSWNKFKSENNL